MANRVRLRQSASTRRGTLPHSEDRQSTARSRDLSLSLEQVVSDATPRTTLYGYVFRHWVVACDLRDRWWCAGMISIYPSFPGIVCSMCGVVRGGVW